MAKFFLMGNFTEKAFAGFLKDPGSDRSEVARRKNRFTFYKIIFDRYLGITVL